MYYITRYDPMNFLIYIHIEDRAYVKLLHKIIIFNKTQLDGLCQYLPMQQNTYIPRASYFLYFCSLSELHPLVLFAFTLFLMTCTKQIKIKVNPDSLVCPKTCQSIHIPSTKQIVYLITMTMTVSNFEYN